MTKLVFFHSKLNNPPLGGGDVHTHEILQCLKQLGFKIYLFLLETQKRPIILRDSWDYEEVHILTEHENKDKIYRCLNEYIEQVNPEAIWVNYPSWGHLLDFYRHRHRLKILYNHHFESVRIEQAKIYTALWNQHVPQALETVHPSLYDLNLFKDKDVQAKEWEYDIYDRYDIVFAIQDRGAKLIQKRCKKTNVYSFPVTLSFKNLSMEYQKLALYTMSPYSFHFQGYYFFVKRVLPLIVEKEPFFRVRLTGIGSEYFLPSKHVICRRYVQNLEEEYQKARLLICPSFSGTGQQVKIVEAMHYGLPVVSMYNPNQFNPIKHKKTGYIAKSAEEFARYVLTLYQDQKFASDMGHLAQRDMRENYPHDLLLKELEKIKLHLKQKLNNFHG